MSLRMFLLMLTSLTQTTMFWTEVGPASMIVGNLVAGKRIAQACGRDLGQPEDNDQARKVDGHLHFTHFAHAH